MILSIFCLHFLPFKNMLKRTRWLKVTILNNYEPVIKSCVKLTSPIIIHMTSELSIPMHNNRNNWKCSSSNSALLAAISSLGRFTLIFLKSTWTALPSGLADCKIIHSLELPKTKKTAFVCQHSLFSKN